VVLAAGPRSSFAAPDARSRLSPLAERAVPIRGARVLVVDDNAVNLLVASAYLRKMGLLAETVESGRAALEQVQLQHFDAILLDLQMPVLDGFATARAIRATEAGRSIPIIALTAAARLADRQAAEASGMNDHIAKPIDPLQLADTLIKWIAPAACQADLPATVRPEPAAPVVLDLGLALQELDGDMELLQAVLASFLEQFTPAAAQLTESLQQQQFKDAARLVHTVKGLAPTLGAQALQQVAQSFETALERHDPSLLPAFNQALEAVLAAITAASPIPGAAGLP